MGLTRTWNGTGCEFNSWQCRILLLLFLLFHLVTHPTKCYTNSKVRAPSEKTNSEPVRIYISCSLSLRLLGSLRGSLGTYGLTQKLCKKKFKIIISNFVFFSMHLLWKLTNTLIKYNYQLWLHSQHLVFDRCRYRSPVWMLPISCRNMAWLWHGRFGQAFYHKVDQCKSWPVNPWSAAGILLWIYVARCIDPEIFLHSKPNLENKIIKTKDKINMW